MLKLSKLRVVCLLSGALFVSASNMEAATISYPDFSDLSAMQLNGATASIGNPATNGSGQKVLRLTNGLSQSGSAFSTNTVALDSNASFSTMFAFQITNPMGIYDYDGQGADGLTFVVQTVANTAGGAGGGIGYQGLPNSVAIEYDTWNNGGWDDYDGNHVGVDIAGNINSAVQAHVGNRMNNGNVWYSWVDYNGVTDTLEVRLSENSSSRPTTAFLSYNVDLLSVLGTTDAYVGFTSGTGAAGGYHDIINWEFESTYKPIGVPEPSTLLLLGSGLVGLAGVRRRFKA